jgi:hypothetical protein
MPEAKRNGLAIRLRDDWISFVRSIELNANREFDNQGKSSVWISNRAVALILTFIGSLVLGSVGTLSWASLGAIPHVSRNLVRAVARSLLAAEGGRPTELIA